MNENLHNASMLRQPTEIGSMRPNAVAGLAGIYQRGVAAGLLRPDLDPLKLRFFLSAVGLFNVSNRQSFTAVFGDRLFSEPEQANLRQMLIDILLGYVMAPNAETSTPVIHPDIHKFLAVWEEKRASLPRHASAADRRKRFERIAAEMRLENARRCGLHSRTLDRQPRGTGPCPGVPLSRQ